MPLNMGLGAVRAANAPREVMADVWRAAAATATRAAAADAARRVNDGVEVVRIAAVRPARAQPLDEVVTDRRHAPGRPLPLLHPSLRSLQSRIEGLDSNH